MDLVPLQRGSDLHDLYGQAFEQRYCEYEAMAAAGKIWSRQFPALELWKSMLKMVFETGHPWITFKDPCNVRSPQDHCGVIHSSDVHRDHAQHLRRGNRCVQPRLSRAGHPHHPRWRDRPRDAERNHHRLPSRWTVMSLISISIQPPPPKPPTPSPPIGLGVMGLPSTLYKRGLAFASEMPPSSSTTK